MRALASGALQVFSWGSTVSSLRLLRVLEWSGFTGGNHPNSFLSNRHITSGVREGLCCAKVLRLRRCHAGCRSGSPHSPRQTACRALVEVVG